MTTLKEASEAISAETAAAIGPEGVAKAMAAIQEVFSAEPEEYLHVAAKSHVLD